MTASTLEHFRGAAGGVVRLSQASPTNATVRHPRGQIELICGEARVTVRLNVQPSPSFISAEVIEVAQEALDLLSISGGPSLATYSAEHEHVLWTQEEPGYVVTVTDTARSVWSTQATATVASGGNAPTPIAPASQSEVSLLVTPHPAFRFIRLARISEDSFDAFRNAYLAFELLVSEKCAKGSSEREVDWLVRALSGPWAAGLPGGLDVVQTVDRIYAQARLQLFHAKANRPFLLPHGHERFEMESAQELLYILLTSMVRSEFGVGNRWAQVSQEITDASALVLRTVDSAKISGGDQEILCSVRTTAHMTPRRFGSPWLSFDFERVRGLEFFDRIELQFADELASVISPAFTVPLSGVHRLRMELNYIERNQRAPGRYQPR